MDKKQLIKQIDEAEKALQTMRSLILEKLEEKARSAEEIAKLVAANQCLRCTEKIVGFPTRGVHEKCYQKLRRDNKLVQALSLGHILPPAKPGPS